LAAFSCVTILLGCANAADTTVPRLVRFSGTISGSPAGTIGAIFALYTDQTGGAPLWQEVQNITVDASGHYATLLGARSQTGIPLDVFSNNEAIWLGVEIQGQPEQPRVLLVSVPYAIKASDAETLGGLPPSAFLRADVIPAATANVHINAAAVTSDAQNAVTSAITSIGTINTIPLFTDDSGDLGNSAISQLGTNIGIGTTSPAQKLAVAGTFSTSDVAGIGIAPLSNVQLNIGGIQSSANNSFGLYMGQLTLQPSSGWDAYFHYGGGTVDTGASNTVSKAVALYGEYIQKAGTGQINNTYGLWINPSTSGTNNYGAYIGGNVGIGTTTPSSPLTVNGTIKSLTGGYVFPDNTVQTTAQLVGPAGPQGPAGPVGPAGPQGPRIGCFCSYTCCTSLTPGGSCGTLSPGSGWANNGFSDCVSSVRSICASIHSISCP